MHIWENIAKTDQPEIEKNHNAHMKKYRTRKHYLENNHMPRMNCTNVCNETWHKQVNYLRELFLTFHRIVNKRVVYVCCCCDQLWYKHGVTSASKLREKCPDVYKYLLNKMSVDNIKWVCRSCRKWLCKSKVPRCAAVCTKTNMVQCEILK